MTSVPDAEAQANRQDEFRDAVLNGLSRRPRAIPCKFLYDARGSALFERICDLEEYYPTRVEVALLQGHARDIARLAGPGCRVVEFGAGSLRKARPLLDALDSPRAYIPIDVSRDCLLRSAKALAADHPGLEVIPLVADYHRPLALPPKARGTSRMLGFFPGSTIGNMPPTEARDFLERTAALLGPDGALVVGVDLRKDEGRLEAAYNDRQGVTAAFTLNLLARANRELGADFDLDAFDHRAHWNARESRVEVHLVSTRPQTVTVDGRRFCFGRGETIHVEDSYKYEIGQFHWLARLGGFDPTATFIDSEELFSVHYLEPKRRQPA